VGTENIKLSDYYVPFVRSDEEAIGKAFATGTDNWCFRVEQKGRLFALKVARNPNMDLATFGTYAQLIDFLLSKFDGVQVGSFVFSFVPILQIGSTLPEVGSFLENRPYSLSQWISGNSGSGNRDLEQPLERLTEILREGTGSEAIKIIGNNTRRSGQHITVTDPCDRVTLLAAYPPRI
jgi:hypothetical protein